MFVIKNQLTTIDHIATVYVNVTTRNFYGVNMNTISTLVQSVIEFHNRIFQLTEYLSTPALLAARLYISWVFIMSGLTKLNDWESTLFLFEYEYIVPVLPFELAAILATAGELVLPVLLALGLFTRFSAIGLSIINIIAVIAYVDMMPASLNLHIVWGLALLANIIYGAGLFSADRKLTLV